ncbi:hypothetical protein TNIN_356421 [Trichonephila inaurata madagascariensis]|uniref:Uncharacterized protein n=1 Tax=Trichonephila inaurata madagascariensis TaxID=2747483 RepID=A0A8X6X912_9ARAC|nr:hypothetical protein TNIN_356421 [Trichonephila inaurata madagascariensis]
MHSISSKYRKPKGRLSKRRAACIRNLEKGKSSACNSSSDNKCDEISTEAVSNISEVDNMKTSTLATLFHFMSTVAKPMHSKCPEGKLSWCFYNKAKADNKVPSSHKSMKTKLSEVVAKIMPV